jgi:hypothetical protein
VEVVCERCGDRVVRQARPHWKPPQRYCGRACSAAAAKAEGRFAGEKNPRFAGWKSRDKIEYRKRFQARYPEKAAAHKAVAYAKRMGRLVPAPCEVCASTAVQAHHDDYSKHLEVRWLCRRCHRDWHKANDRPMGSSPPSPGAPS